MYTDDRLMCEFKGEISSAQFSLCFSFTLRCDDEQDCNFPKGGCQESSREGG